MPEKLLTLQEASIVLGISEHELKSLVKKGELPAYKIGGRFLRFRKEQIEALTKAFPTKSVERPPKSMPKIYPRDSQSIAQPRSIIDGIFDFFYFNDFYIIATAVSVIILWVIFKQ